MMQQLRSDASVVEGLCTVMTSILVCTVTRPLSTSSASRHIMRELIHDLRRLKISQSIQRIYHVCHVKYAESTSLIMRCADFMAVWRFSARRSASMCTLPSVRSSFILIEIKPRVKLQLQVKSTQMWIRNPRVSHPVNATCQALLKTYSAAMNHLRR